MPSISEPIVVAVIAIAGTLGAGSIGILIQSIFQKPENRANISDLNTDTAIKLLRERDLDNTVLRKTVASMKRHTAKRERKLAYTENRLRETTDALRLLTDTITRTPLVLRKTDENQTDDLGDALDVARHILNRP